MVTELNLQNQNSPTCKIQANRRHLLKAQAHKELNIASTVSMCGWLCVTASLLQKVGTQAALFIEAQLSLK